MRTWHAPEIASTLLAVFVVGLAYDTSLQIEAACRPAEYWCAPFEPQPGHTLPRSAVARVTITASGSSSATYTVIPNTVGGPAVSIPLWAQTVRWPDYPVGQQAVAAKTPPD
jgi:hypothetical protein